MKYKVVVTTPGHVLIFRGRQARTPVVFWNVSKSEIEFIDSQARRSLLKYEVREEQIPEKKEPYTEDIQIEKDDSKIEIENLPETRKPSTILETLIAKSEK